MATRSRFRRTSGWSAPSSASPSLWTTPVPQSSGNGYCEGRVATTGQSGSSSPGRWWSVTITSRPCFVASATSSAAVIPQSTVRTRPTPSSASRASVSPETPYPSSNLLGRCQRDVGAELPQDEHCDARSRRFRRRRSRRGRRSSCRRRPPRECARRPWPCHRAEAGRVPERPPQESYERPQGCHSLAVRGPTPSPRSRPARAPAHARREDRGVRPSRSSSLAVTVRRRSDDLCTGLEIR